MNPTMKTVAQFAIPYFRYLNEAGELEQPAPDFAQDRDYLISLYRMMLLTRLFDKKAIALQRTGKIGTYPSTLGQEAINVGIGASMREDDIFCPYYRECGAQFWRGVKMEEILLYWGGDERGSHFTANSYDFPICVPIASQTLHAVGAATAITLRKQDRVVVTAIGDGGTSRGDFYEAINVAGAWNLPVVFVINNNHWAISVPCEEQTKAQTFAQKAIAAGLPGLQVDGNDIFAVKAAITQAVENARQGKGAMVIEALSYRMGDHTTADDASRYRNIDELKANEKKDPVLRLKNYLLKNKLWDETQEENLLAELGQLVNQAVENFESIAMPKLGDMFDYLYETLPTALQAQRQAVTGEGK